MELNYLKLFNLILMVQLVTTQMTSQPCIKGSFLGSSYICICNATYCDTIEPESNLPEGRFMVYSSAKYGPRFEKSIHSFRNASKKGHISVSIDVNSTKQTILGFGGTFTDAAGMNIASLPKGARDLLIESYYGPSGIEYNLGRIPIASNDMSTDVYSYDFTNDDTGLSKFTISEYDHLYKLPYIDKAVVASRRKVLLFGSPWSSPDWMKSNDNMVGYGVIAPNMSKPYANYLARFLSEYEGFMLHGRMWGLTTQSGPSRSCDLANSTLQYQSMCWTAKQMRDWIVHELRPSLNDNGYGHIKLMVMDDNRDQLEDWLLAFNDSESRNAFDGFAVHWYKDNVIEPEVFGKAHKLFPEKFVLGSEACIRDANVSYKLGSWEQGEEYGRRIFQDLNNYVTAFTDYNLAVNMSGGPSWVKNYAVAPVVVNSDTAEFYKIPIFYAIGHFSKFVTTGSKVLTMLSAGQTDTDMPMAAFLRPDGSIVFIVSNMLDHDMGINVVVGGKIISYKLDQQSINTFIW